MNTIAINEISKGQFDIQFENGTFVEESLENSFAKHNLFCFGRLDKNATINPLLRKGFTGSFFEDQDMFSISWVYYLERNINLNSISRIIDEFNKSCDRDYKNGFFDQRVKITKGSKIDKNTISFKILIGDSEEELILNL